VRYPFAVVFPLVFVVRVKHVFVEPRPSALNTTLAAFAAERRRLQHGACSTAPATIDRYLLQTLAISSKPTGRRCCCRSTGQTDRRADGRPTVT